MRGPPHLSLGESPPPEAAAGRGNRGPGRALLRLPRPAPYQHEPPWRPGARGFLSE